MPIRIRPSISMPIQIQIQIGIKFQINANPHADPTPSFTQLEIGPIFYTYIHNNSSLHCFSFLISATVFWNAYWNFHEKRKKYMCLELIPGYRSGSACPGCRCSSVKMMRIRPDQDPQRCGESDINWSPRSGSCSETLLFYRSLKIFHKKFLSNLIIGILVQIRKSVPYCGPGSVIRITDPQIRRKYLRFWTPVPVYEGLYAQLFMFRP